MGGQRAPASRHATEPTAPASRHATEPTPPGQNELRRTTALLRDNCASAAWARWHRGVSEGGRLTLRRRGRVRLVPERLPVRKRPAKREPRQCPDEAVAEVLREQGLLVGGGGVWGIRAN